MFSSGAQAQQPVALKGIKVQSSIYGAVIPIVYGSTRISMNLLWYGDFAASPVSTATGGK